MEPPKGFLLSLWHFICFLPYFIGLLLLGILKGKSSQFSGSCLCTLRNYPVPLQEVICFYFV